MNANMNAKMHFYVMEKFTDFFTLRPSDLSTTLTYVLMNILSLFNSVHGLELLFTWY